MKGETDLATLLKGASPVLNPGEYVFCTLATPSQTLLASAVATIKEQEGHTLVLPKVLAEQQGLEFAYVAAWITLTVHSDLAAVGLTAAFAGALARHQISCNVMAGYYHDHIFVAHQHGAKAVAVLNRLAT
jgi:uncharacterized protein